MPTPAHPLPSRWQIVCGAPHRLLFLGGALQIVLAMGWWAAVLAGRLGLPLPASAVIPAPGLHAWLMIYGTFPFFIFGFLFTVYPRWRGQPPVAPPVYVFTFAALALGTLLVYLGLYTRRTVLLAGLLLYLAGFVRALLALYRVAGRGGWRDPHLRLLNLALAAGAFGIEPAQEVSRPAGRQRHGRDGKRGHAGVSAPGEGCARLLACRFGDVLQGDDRHAGRLGVGLDAIEQGGDGGAGVTLCGGAVATGPLVLKRDCRTAVPAAA